MAKGKTIGTAELEELLDYAEALTESVLNIRGACSGCRIESTAEMYGECANVLVVTARDLLNAAMSLASARESQVTRDKIAAMQAEKSKV